MAGAVALRPAGSYRATYTHVRTTMSDPRSTRPDPPPLGPLPNPSGHAGQEKPGAADDLGLAGKVAIVTGGGAPDDGIGNGRAAAMLLARAGARVLVVDIVPEAAEQTVAMISAEGG